MAKSFRNMYAMSEPFKFRIHDHSTKDFSKATTSGWYDDLEFFVECLQFFAFTIQLGRYIYEYLTANVAACNPGDAPQMRYTVMIAHVQHIARTYYDALAAFLTDRGNQEFIDLVNGSVQCVFILLVLTGGLSQIRAALLVDVSAVMEFSLDRMHREEIQELVAKIRMLRRMQGNVMETMDGKLVCGMCLRDVGWEEIVAEADD